MAGYSNARPVKYLGISFKSQIEKKTYQIFRAKGFDIQYEKKTFILQDAVVFMGKKYRPISYTPDFNIIDNRGCSAFIECKGYENESFALRMKLFIKMLADRDDGSRYFMVRKDSDILTVLNSINYEVKKKRIPNTVLRNTRNKQFSTASVPKRQTGVLQQLEKLATSKNRKRTNGSRKTYSHVSITTRRILKKL